MITQTFGIVAPTSTTVATVATANITSLNPPGKAPVSFWTQAVSFQAVGTNTATVYICDTPNPNVTTGIGVCWEVPAPDGASNKSRPAWVIGDPSRSNNPVNVAQFYILPVNTGEGLRVTGIKSGTQQNTLSCFILTILLSYKIGSILLAAGRYLFGWKDFRNWRNLPSRSR